jgi:polysaccharide biosynthesis/export protein
MMTGYDNMMRRLLCALLCWFSSAAIANSNYPLGPGDVVRISVYGQNDLNSVARISELNRVSLPLIGEIEIGGIPPAEAEQRIEKALLDGGFVREPQVTVAIEQQHSRQVSVLGHVHKPAQYSIDQPLKLIDILTLAGGISQEGSDTIRLIRNSDSDAPEQIDINIRTMLSGSDLSKNLAIENNSIIYVAPMEKFYIYGQVNRPGAYRLEPGMTVMQALAVGGGINIKGSESGLRISRHHHDGAIEEIEADARTRLQPNDVIYVKERLF